MNRRRIVALLALLLGALQLGTGLASAAPTPSPSPSATPTAESTGPPKGPYIGVTLVDNSEKDEDGNGTPVPGVTLAVIDDAGTEIGSAATDADGRVLIPIPKRGTYQVKLDTGTLPQGVKLSGAADTTKTVNAVLDGGNFAQFQIGTAEVETTGKAKRFIDSMVSGLKFGLMVALAALGLSLIYGTTGLTNFAHGELITFGAIMTFAANWTLGVPVAVAAVISLIIGGVFGWLQDRIIWRPLRNRGTGVIAMMIVSIGFALVLRNVFQYTFGGSTRPLSQYVGQSRNDYGPFSLADKEIGIMVVAATVIIVVCIALVKTRMGKAMRAVSDNTALSSASGLRVDGVISNVWILGTALTALAGTLLAINQQVNFLMGLKLLLLVFAGVILGGLGTIWGAVIGSLVIGIMVEVSPMLGVPSSIKEVGALAVLIVVLLLRPQGILGRRERIG